MLGCSARWQLQTRHSLRPLTYVNTQNTEPKMAALGTDVQYVPSNDTRNDQVSFGTISSEPSRMMGYYNTVCTGTLGLGLKAVGLIVAIIFIFIIGYITGYYVHKCP
ncbi:small integral membrane protein 1 [Polypterus senegalus]|uniref:small integral membrane protein 1 n=1 Tax=Polypterus senegalus TaxID=55291 RepID=UPI0019665A80|nr:small integral membrane protein 1 [Polypterus senegalus]